MFFVRRNYLTATTGQCSRLCKLFATISAAFVSDDILLSRRHSAQTQLVALRFLLGASEICMSEGLMIVTGMFYTRREVSERIGWAYQCQGLAIVISGFLSYAFAHVSPTENVKPWQWFSIASALLTLVSCLLFLTFFPNNPTTAWFLTQEERVTAIRRVRENQNGIETKVWKRHQFVEAILDPKTWLYFALATFGSLTGGISVQYALLIRSFGFTLFETTLLGIPSGFAVIIGIIVAGLAVRRFPVRVQHRMAFAHGMLT